MQKISECEELIMSVIWSSEEVLDSATIIARANKRFNKNWKPQTVSTFLVRLVKKEFLSSMREGRHHYYVPLVAKNDYVKYLLDEITIRFLGEKERIEIVKK